MVTSCDLNAPRCTTEVLRVRLHGSREVPSLVTDPRGTPVTPRYMLKKKYRKNSTSVEMLHTHTERLDWQTIHEVSLVQSVRNCTASFGLF